MIVKERYLQELNKLSVLKDIENDNFRISDIALFKEYLTRLGQWKTELGVNSPDFYNKRKSYHNLFIDLSPEWINQIIPEVTVIHDLRNIGLTNVYYALKEFQGYFLFLYVNWQVFSEMPEIRSHLNLKSPYEPLFIIVSRGGTINFSENKFVIDHKIFVKTDGDFQLPTTQIDFLNYLDINLKGEPDQDQVTVLWEIYNTEQPLTFKANERS